MNKIMITRMMFNKELVSNFFKVHLKFRKSKDYKIRNIIKCGLNVIKNDAIIKHDNYYLVNSFIPPLNSKAFYNIAMQVPGENEDFFINHTKGIRLAPISTYIAITNRCMYNCWHCSASNQDSNQDYSTENALYLIRQLKKLKVGIIGITGGEPLLRDDLEIIIKEINDDALSLLFTTGYKLTYERALELKKAGLFGIGISLDSHDKKIHDELRGAEFAYEHAVEAIKNAKRAGLYTMSQTVCTKELLDNDNLLKLASLCKQLNVDEMRILEPLPCGRLEDESKAILSGVDQTRLKNMHIVLNQDKKYPKASVFSYFESKDQFGCGAGIQHSYIDSSGNFGPCDFLEDKYGNIFDQDISEIWNKMHYDCGSPKSVCLAKCKKSLQSELPLFYKLMGGKK